MLRYNNELFELCGPPRLFRHRANAVLQCRDFTIRTNDLGLRGPSIEVPKKTGERRLLFLGDSVTLGWGAEEQDLFLTLAEKELQQYAEPGSTFRCVNAGHNLHDTAQELGVLQELGDKIQPDAVLLTYAVNDVVSTLALYEEAMKAPVQSPLMQWIGWVLLVPFRGWGGLYNYFQQVHSGAEEVTFKEAVGAALNSRGWVESRESLVAMHAWCRQRGIPFLVLDHTPQGDGIVPAAIPGLRPLLQEHGIPHFPFHFTPEENRAPIRHSAADPHANAAGHRLLLVKLRPALRSLGFRTR